MALFAEGIVTIRPATEATFERFLDEFTRIEAPFLVRCGIEITAGWRRFGGVANQLYNLYRFESLTAMQEAGARQRQDQEFADANIYSWVDAPNFRYHRHLRTSLPYPSAERLAEVQAEHPALSRHYVERRRRFHFLKHGEALPLLRADLEERESRGDFRPVLAYDTLFGEHGEVTVIGMLPEGASHTDAFARDTESSAALERYVDADEIHRLEPLPYSPLR
jgi:hypothetical protein